MTDIALAVAWEWPPDSDFVHRLLSRAVSMGLMSLEIRPDNLQPILAGLAARRLRIRNLLDRASDVYPELAQLVLLAEQTGTRIINHIRHQNQAGDKARNHRLCAAWGIPVPFTTIVPPFSKDPLLPELPAALGRPFVAKPAGGGGGLGVILDVQTREGVQEARRTYPHDRYLLQQRITPSTLGGKRAWFRVFYVCGLIIPCWWDDLTHIYSPLESEEEKYYGLTRLRTIARQVAQITALDFFTTEIALASDGRLVCIDYANSPCDMRLQSQHADGVPDAVVECAIDALVSFGLSPAPQHAAEWSVMTSERA